MKTISTLSVILLLFVLSNCNNYQVPKTELPQWLIEEIEEDEAEIKNNRLSYLRYGKWTRYEFLGDRYYEYSNSIEGTTFIPRDEANGDAISDVDLLQQYFNEKCCATVVWKGPRAD
jgi:hypothetical protein